MTRVLLVGKGAPDRGGIPTFLEQLRTGPLAERHVLTFFNVAHEGTPEGGAVTWGNIRRTMSDAFGVWRAARNHEVVHINSALAPTVTLLRAGLLAFAGRLGGCAVIVHAHGGNVETYLARARSRVLVRVALAACTMVVACWSTGEEVLSRSLGRGRVRRVLNGVDTTRFQPSARPAHDPPRVLYVGLLTPRKGVLDLLAASKQLRREGVDHELRLLGGTPDEGPAAAERVLAEATGCATLAGTRPPEEMPTEYAAADVFCLPSWWEAMPLSVLEAMASGLPVVATDVGEVPHIVVEGETGFVVDIKSPEGLTAALRKLLTDTERARAMGEAGRRRVVEQLSADATAAAIDHIYAEVVRGRA